MSARKECHHIMIRVFCKPPEDEARILEKLKQLSHSRKPVITRTEALAADNESKIIILETKLEKKQEINDFLYALRKNLSSEAKDLLLQQENRLDAQGDYYLRLDKNRFINDIYRLTDGGDCYHIKMCLAAYPKNKQMCMEKIRSILKISPFSCEIFNSKNWSTIIASRNTPCFSTEIGSIMNNLTNFCY